MIKLLETISNLMNAITFAEAGEFETARQMMPVSAAGDTESVKFKAVLTGTSLS